MRKKINEIIYREDLYPRFEPDKNKIMEYSENIELLPPILINQDNILIDGYHRLRAHEIAKLEDVPVIIEKTESEEQLYLRAIETNAIHGLQLSNKDKKKIAIKMYDGSNSERLRTALSVSERSFRGWVSNKEKELKEERNEKILELYLTCHTQQQIADEVGVERTTVTKYIENVKNGKYAENHNMSKFEPMLYNIWNLKEKDSNNQHFGLFPEIFFENLLYYHTKPFDVVYDPFCGGGTAIDCCKKWLRRYYVSDLTPIELRKEEIKQWDIEDGLPEDLPKPNFVFLDPPYWIQAKSKYSEKKSDMANIELDAFYEKISNLAKLLKAKMDMGGIVAFVISPTQYPNENYVFEDHIIKIINIFEKFGFNEKIRYLLPYSTEQYNGTQVNIAKTEKFCLSIIRDLVVFEKK